MSQDDDRPPPSKPPSSSVMHPFQPPFPVQATSSESKTSSSSPSSHPHPQVESLINATAKHILPDEPISHASPETVPKHSPSTAELEQCATATTMKRNPTSSSPNVSTSLSMSTPFSSILQPHVAREREEHAIVSGTPLDETLVFMEEPNQLEHVDESAGNDDKSHIEYMVRNNPSRPLSSQTQMSPDRDQTIQPETKSTNTITESRLRNQTLCAHNILTERDLDSTQSSTSANQHSPSTSRPTLSPCAGPRSGGARTRSATVDVADMGSIRMGTSALISALNALPWEHEDDTSDDEEAESEDHLGRSIATPSSTRPKVNRLHSSLHTIRPMDSVMVDQSSAEDIEARRSTRPRRPVHKSRLSFPFKENAIARRARSPRQNEIAYQMANVQTPPRHPISPGVPLPKGYASSSSQSSEESSVFSTEPTQVQAVQTRVEKEERIAEQEEALEKVRASQEQENPEEEEVTPAQKKTGAQIMKEISLAPVITPESVKEMENTGATLRKGNGKEQEIDQMMQSPPNEKERRSLRKAKLAERLQEVFGLEDREEVIEEMRCWLLRSIMLKGYMYLTQRHICFFAHMPDRENSVIKTGPLYKKASRTKLSTKYWVVLRNDVLSWYESTNDPYFPKGNISLQYASSCDAMDQTRFKLRTSERSYTFAAETESSRDEWMKAIQRVMFKTQHEGESVKLIIPLEAVDEVERSPTLEFAETIEIRVVDPEDAMSVDSYFFASFQDNDYAFDAIKKRLEERPSSELPRVHSNFSDNENSEGSQITVRKPENTPSSVAHIGFSKLGSVFRPFISRSTDKVDDSTITGSSPTSESRTPIAIPTRPMPMTSTQASSETEEEDDEDFDGTEASGYPPRPSGRPPPGLDQSSQTSTWTSQWLKKPAAKLFGTSPSSGYQPPPISSRDRRPKKKSFVTEIIEPILPSEESGADDDDDERGGAVDAKEDDGNDDNDVLPNAFNQTSGKYSSGTQGARMSFLSASSTDSQAGVTRSRSDYSMVEKSESGHREDQEIAKKFRSVFALSEKEELIDHFPGYLYRVLPVAGRFFVSTNYFCFRSSQLLYKTKMIVPIRDLYGLKAQKAFRFGHSGLIVVIKGHEELFLEFSSSKRRKACIALLEERMDVIRLRSQHLGDSGGGGEVGGRGGVGSETSDDDAAMETRINEDLDESQPLETRSGLPPISPSPLFGSTTSTFLEFKPEPMRITCLTIGSRGDVQPYIALCKGLQAEGHTTKIATHGEYKDWVEGHGIEFASVGGDPAELMQMCVDNGMFTVSFLKEGLQKFRGWLDDLLMSSWQACQGSDLLIESPSAMGGMHIAEALRIPYFRAFTMPWTRTRAYPHAFAVPEHKRGGSYNYMTYTMFDQVFWRAISGQINRWRKKVLGIESTTFDKLEQHKIPFLYNFSPTVVPPPLDWTEWIHVTGYWFLENADESAKKKKWSPPEGLVEFIDGAHAKGKKVVYIGFGSIVVSDPKEMTRCVIDAVINSDVCAILSKGWSDRGSRDKGESGDKTEADGIKYPPEIYSIDSIDHTWLFPRIDAACHHGGAGTSGASLRAGIPTIIKPFFGDQAFWAERVESLGVGTAVRKLTSENLADALRHATSDERQIAKARAVGEMIRKENGVTTAIEAIYRDLEYAKSIIKPGPNSHSDDNNSPLDKVSNHILHSLKSRRSHESSLGRALQGKPADALSTSSTLIMTGKGEMSRLGGRSLTRSTASSNEGDDVERGGFESGSRPLSTDREDMRSEGSWAVLSDSEKRIPSGVGRGVSPSQSNVSGGGGGGGGSGDGIPRSESESYDEEFDTTDDPAAKTSDPQQSSNARRARNIPGLGSIVGHLLPSKIGHKGGN